MGHGVYDEHTERLLQEFKSFAEADIIREDGSCDWKAVRKVYNKRWWYEKQIYFVLLEKNILSTTLEGNYIILRGNHLWGPYYGMVGHVAFVRKEDAESYFDLFFDQHGSLDVGPAQIIHCTDVQVRKESK